MIYIELYADHLFDMAPYGDRIEHAQGLFEAGREKRSRKMFSYQYPTCPHRIDLKALMGAEETGVAAVLEREAESSHLTRTRPSLMNRVRAWVARRTPRPWRPTPSAPPVPGSRTGTSAR
ncbi:MAG: hypothetical protein JSV66_12335 [Trueperaceae bacterium]|nr:MAG: hypothetical protein JSV66_12335 [Trueperaceae bacterium]